MKLLCAVLLQLLSFASLAASDSPLLVTVTVVRPVAVTTVIDANGRASSTSVESREQPKTVTVTNDGIQRVTVDY